MRCGCGRPAAPLGLVWRLGSGEVGPRGEEAGELHGGELDLWDETGWESVVQWVNTCKHQ